MYIALIIGICLTSQDLVAGCLSNVLCPQTNCVWSTWSTWTRCENNRRFRVRMPTAGAVCGTELCVGPDKETEACQVQSLTCNCILEQWSPWGFCINGEHERKRDRQVQETGNGACPGPYMETQPCSGNATDCIWGEWSGFRGCNGTAQFRIREKVQKAEFGGKDCVGLDLETEPCSIVCGTGSKVTFTVNSLGINMIGGQPVLDTAKWPWMAAVVNLNNLAVICGAVIISENWILSAAHCIDGILTNNIAVVAECADAPFSCNVQKTLPNELRIHPNYTNTVVPFGLTNDFVMIRFDSAIPLTGPTSPVCLPSPGSVDINNLTSCFTAGFGLQGQTGTAGGTLREVNVKVLDGPACLLKYPSLNLAQSSPIICAEPITSPGKACNGDSGGPLMCRVGLNSQYTLVGVATYPEAPCDPNAPQVSVYSEVNAVRDWITQICTNCFLN